MRFIIVSLGSEDFNSLNMWDGDDCKYCGVCLTSDLENQFVFSFTKDMGVTEAIEFANRLNTLKNK